MKLIPLKQWYCDKCGQVIEKPEQGWLEWLHDGKFRAYGFKIVHHLKYSPIGNEDGAPSCYHYDHLEACRMDDHLDHFVGEDGLAVLLSMIDPDPRDRSAYPEVVNIREWAKLVRRLYVPHYEEARRYWVDASNDGMLADLNELQPYLQETLKEIISTYSEQDEQEATEESCSG